MMYGLADDEISLDSVSHIKDLSDLLAEVDIDPVEVCILGSGPLSVLDVHPNSDIDIVASSQVRQRIIDFAKNDPDSWVSNHGMAFVGDNVELLMKDRLCKGPYHFGITDDELIHSDKFHFNVSGYKFGRPELILSMKGVKHREKDQRHVAAIEDSDLFSTADWDWGRVYVTPPWRRNDPISLFDQGVNSLKNDGLVKTAEQMAGFAEYKLSEFKKSVGSIPAQLWRRRSDRVVLYPPVSKDVNIHYPLPNILSRQYDDNSEFTGWEIIDNLIDLEENQVERKSFSPSKNTVTISKTGMVLSNHSTIAAQIDEWSDEFPKNAIEKSFIVTVNDEPDRPCGFDITSQMESRRDQLLIETGTAFHAVLWPAVRSEFDELEKRLRSRFRVIESREYLLENELSTFIQSVYSRDERSKKWFIKNKIRKLGQHRPMIRLISFEVPDPYFIWDSGQYVSHETMETKLELRKHLEETYEEYAWGTGIHMTDNFQNNAHIADLRSSIEETSRMD